MMCVAKRLWCFKKRIVTSKLKKKTKKELETKKNKNRDKK